jgi:TRAP transporter TAXI family solute receptor
VKAARLGHQAQADALKNRSIEVMVVSPGIPTGAVADVINTADGVLLSATEADVKATVAKVPYMDRGVIPANTYDKHPKDIVTVVLPSLLFVAAALPEETVYRITKSVYENTDRLAKVHVNGREWTPKSALASREFLIKSGFDYHPGAIRYFKEKGVW